MSHQADAYRNAVIGRCAALTRHLRRNPLIKVTVWADSYRLDDYHFADPTPTDPYRELIVVGYAQAIRHVQGLETEYLAFLLADGNPWRPNPDVDEL